MTLAEKAIQNGFTGQGDISEAYAEMMKPDVEKLDESKKDEK